MKTIGVLIGFGLAVYAAFSMGYLIAKNKYRLSVGSLRVETSDPDGPYMFLELHKNVSDIVSMKQVTFDVEVTNISRK